MHSAGCENLLFVFQVDALYDERRRKLQELENELNEFAGVKLDKHLRRSIDAYAEWIRATGPKATLREINGVKKGIRQIVRKFHY